MLSIRELASPACLLSLCVCLCDHVTIVFPAGEKLRDLKMNPGIYCNGALVKVLLRVRMIGDDDPVGVL